MQRSQSQWRCGAYHWLAHGVKPYIPHQCQIIWGQLVWSEHGHSTPDIMTANSMRNSWHDDSWPVEADDNMPGTVESPLLCCCDIASTVGLRVWQSAKPGALLLFHSTGDARRMQCNAHVWPSASFDTSSSVSCWAGCSPVHCKGREGWMVAESMFNFFLLFKRREISGSNWIFTTTRGYESDSHQSWRWERNEIYPWLASLNTNILSSGLCQTQKLFSLLLPKYSTT